MVHLSCVSKEDLALMPREVFNGAITVVDTEAQLSEAVSFLSSYCEIGFDTETRPSFAKRVRYKMALMQLSTMETCFLIRLNKLKSMPAILEDFLRNRDIKKIGLSLHDDFSKLHTVTKIAPENFIDLQKYVVPFGIVDMSLQKIYATVFGKRISKSERLSNWEKTALTNKQQMYAAIDAWACLRIYRFLEENKDNITYENPNTA